MGLLIGLLIGGGVGLQIAGSLMESEREAQLAEQEAALRAREAEEQERQAAFRERQAAFAREESKARASLEREGGVLARAEARLRAAGVVAQTLDVGEQAAQARGRIAAAAGVGGLAGGSVLRQAARVQRLAMRQTGLLGAQATAIRTRGEFAQRSALTTAQLMERGGVLRAQGFELAARGSRFAAEEALLRASQLQEQADFARSQGVLTAISSLLGGLGQALSIGSSLASPATSVTSPMGAHPQFGFPSSPGGGARSSLAAPIQPRDEFLTFDMGF